MILGFIIGIIVAFVLTFIHVDHTIISVIKDIAKIDIGHTGYYVIMGIVGGISRVMIGGIVTGIVFGYVLTLVNFDHFVVSGLKEWFKYDGGIGVYYLIFAVLGAGMSFLKVVRLFLSPLFFLARRKA